MNAELKIKSDFRDYYDSASTSKSNLVYERYYSNAYSRAKGISVLKAIGFKTIEIGPVNQIALMHKQVVVYTNANEHMGQGKIVMTANDALLTYPNCLASPFYECTSDITTKFVKIGSRGFKIQLRNSEQLKSDIIVDIKEDKNKGLSILKVPIYSIDYINYSGMAMATELNSVQRLDYLQLETVISANEVISEISQILLI
jgi:hypothetical protein